MRFSRLYLANRSNNFAIVNLKMSRMIGSLSSSAPVQSVKVSFLYKCTIIFNNLEGSVSILKYICCIRIGNLWHCRFVLARRCFRIPYDRARTCSTYK